MIFPPVGLELRKSFEMNFSSSSRIKMNLSHARPDAKLGVTAAEPVAVPLRLLMCEASPLRGKREGSGLPLEITEN